MDPVGLETFTLRVFCKDQLGNVIVATIAVYRDKQTNKNTRLHSGQSEDLFINVK
jgi:hypothetical protein